MERINLEAITIGLRENKERNLIALFTAIITSLGGETEMVKENYHNGIFLAQIGTLLVGSVWIDAYLTGREIMKKSKK